MNTTRIRESSPEKNSNAKANEDKQRKKYINQGMTLLRLECLPGPSFCNGSGLRLLCLAVAHDECPGAATGAADVVRVGMATDLPMLALIAQQEGSGEVGCPGLGEGVARALRWLVP